MDKAYDPQVHDQKWQKFWEQEQISQPEVARQVQKLNTGKSFTIVMPPPNVTGVLHQGHALGTALQDCLIRFRRMSGDDALFVPGTDHASIAVQMQVMKHLESQGLSGREMGREKFLEHCWAWIKNYQPRIYAQLKTLGTSCDWSRVKFTLDPECNEAVTYAFVELYRKGLIYRAQKLVNWSPAGQTGLSDLEVKYEDREGSLWHLKYPLENSPDLFLTVATTRPETMLGDTAVAVHPEDDRYRHLIGKKVLLPIVNRLIPIVGDTYVDPAFGSGVVKITPAHDFNDFEVGTRHQLPLINIFSKQAKVLFGLGGEAEDYAGLDRFEARKKVLAHFEARGLLDKVEKHKNRVGVSERWGDVVEPFLSYQWFCKVDGMAQLAADSAVRGDLKIVPAEFHNQFLRWMENIHDWCISRQLWWGHRIPAYHCQDCHHIEVSETAPGQCPQCSSRQWEQDEDVLDTWFSSALWPLSTLGWPRKNLADFEKFYPTQVMETGFDILFFWVARMVMMGQHFTGRLPFDRVFMHPMVRDEDGQKMSKTKGNVVDPLEIIRDYGADTFRMTLNALCVQGRDMRLSTERLDVYRNFINKIWNATKFCLMQPLKDAGAWRERARCSTRHLHDRWILTQLDVTARDVAKAWSEYRMQEAAELLYQFAWNDFCDWYLESVKLTREESQNTLYHVLGEILKLLHPLMPHVTEELFHALPGVEPGESLAVQAFPQGEGFPDATALAEHQFLRDCVGALRNLRAENKVALNKKIPAYVSLVDELSQKVLSENQAVIVSLAKLEDLRFGAVTEASTKCIVRSVKAGLNIEIEVPLGGLVDRAEETARLKKEMESATKLLQLQRAKLENKSFVNRAPPEVVEKEKLKLAEYLDKVQKTEVALKNLG